MVNLCVNLNINILGKKTVNIKKINASTLIGKGTLTDLLDEVNLKKLNLLICNSSLTPNQQRNLENILKVKVVDRSGIIIEIFAKRALSNEGKLQVQLAEMVYRKSRLVRAWTHLERQRGGTSFVGGPGELQIELDRRLIQERIEKIKKRLKNVSKRRSIQRKQRSRNNFKIFAIVGYTNAGKTLLFNQLTKQKKESANKLFATLEEINESDYIINVVDINDINFQSKINTTKKILKETGVSNYKIKNMITVFNKIDLQNKTFNNSSVRSYVSALTGDGLEQLKKQMTKSI